MNEPEISASAGVTGGFGDALTTALDVMAFTHDIDLTQVTDGITTSNAATKAKIQQSNLIHVGTRSQDTITTTHPSVAITTGNAIGNMMISTELNGQKVLESRSIGKNGCYFIFYFYFYICFSFIFHIYFYLSLFLFHFIVRR